MASSFFVCTTCGLSVAASPPDHCDRCGAPASSFLDHGACSRRHRVRVSAVTGNVQRLRTEPPLGPPHDAYALRTGSGALWINCPPSYDPALPAPGAVLFSHRHCLGAGALYRERSGCHLGIHRLEAGGDALFDRTFDGSFQGLGVEAVHVGGLAEGFLAFFFGDALFPGDFVLFEGGSMRLNPRAPARRIETGARRLHRALEGRSLRRVLGHGGAWPFDAWFEAWRRLPAVRGAGP